MGNKGGGSVVLAEVNNAFVLRIPDLFIIGENPETAGG
jgi:hypothetical protein